MLVLSRKVGESITIGEETTVRVVSVRGNTVRLAIDAPTWLKIFRAELLTPLDESSIQPRPGKQQESH